MPLLPFLLPDQPVTSLDDYLERGGGEGLALARDLGPEAVIEEITRSGLRGRGGAGFPTGVKWASTRAAEGRRRYAVCNAAEGEPATFKDRALMRRNPYQCIEGLAIAALCMEAHDAYLATKAKFEAERSALELAAREMDEAGLLAGVTMVIVAGPDEYLFGEETALLEVVEGKLPMPRILPPYMYGLHATMQTPNPTVVNNVETLAHVADIVAGGAESFRRQGTQEAPGTMVFTVVGDVTTPGVYELPLGTPLRTLLVDIAGAGDIKAIYSGVSNAVVTPDIMDLPMDFDSFAEAGTGLGSGGFVVYDDTRCIVDVVTALSRFLAVESCAQCPPFKLHGVEIWERLAALCAGQSTASDLEAIRRRCSSVTDGNRCYLPVGHALVVRSALDTFADEFAAATAEPHTHDHPVVVPKIEDLDGDVVFDESYSRKNLDWSYAQP